MRKAGLDLKHRVVVSALTSASTFATLVYVVGAGKKWG